MSERPDAARSVDDVLALFEGFAGERYDEEVSQLEHALQTAALATLEGADDALVVAALLHDVGHLLEMRDGLSAGHLGPIGSAGSALTTGSIEATGSVDAAAATGRSDAARVAGQLARHDGSDLLHEARGARWLAHLYGPEVTGPIALHVAAKRYACAVDSSYHDTLSEGSKASLVRQGGPMDEREAARFRANPAHAAAIVLRRWDDSAKLIDADVPPLAEYRPLLDELAR